MVSSPQERGTNIIILYVWGGFRSPVVCGVLPLPLITIYRTYSFSEIVSKMILDKILHTWSDLPL